jgi:SPP1 gp7 family putative phage head morphogenesis protein
MKFLIMAIALSFFAPHTEAIEAIQSKPAIVREVFDGLLPELRARAFTITGIQAADVLQRVQDEIASLPEGTPWDEAKQNIVDTLDPYLGDAAEQRAELLLRTHGFQAFQSATWNIAQKDADTIALQYMTMEDDRVRPTHEVLDGIIVPKNDPFWKLHFPPWEWGCRCRVRPMNIDLINAQRATDRNKNPEDQLVIEGAELKQLRNNSIIGDGGQRVDITPPSQEPGAENAYIFHPSNLSLPLEQLKERYDPEVWTIFEEWAKQMEIEPGKTVWDWLAGNGGAQ